MRSKLTYWPYKAARPWLPMQATAGSSRNSHSRHLKRVAWVQPSVTGCPQALVTSRNCSCMFKVSRSLQSLIRFPSCQVRMYIVWIQKGKIISTFRETIIVANGTLAMCGAVLTSLGRPQSSSDILADQTAVLLVPFMQWFCEVVNTERVWRVGLLSSPLILTSQHYFKSACIKILKLSFFCCMLSHPICVTFILKVCKFLELGPVFSLCLPVIIGHWALRPLTKTTIAILTVIIFFLFLSVLVYFLHTSQMHDENQLHQFHFFYSFVFLV